MSSTIDEYEALLQRTEDSFWKRMEAVEKQLKLYRAALSIAIDFVYPIHKNGACPHFYQREKMEESIMLEAESKIGVKANNVSSW